MPTNESVDRFAAEHFEFLFDITYDDVVESRRFVANSPASLAPNPRLSRNPLFNSAIAVVAMLCFIVFNLGEQPGIASDLVAAWNWMINAAPWIMAAVAGYFALRLWGRRRLRRMLTEHPEYQNCRFTLSKELFAVRTGPQTIEIRWDGVLRVAVTERHIYFYIAENAAHFLPRRAIGGADDVIRLLTRLRSWYSGRVTDEQGNILTATAALSKV